MLAKDFIDAKGKNLRVADASLFGEYDANVLSARAVGIIDDHPLNQGLYIYLAYHAVHDPQEAPCAAVERYLHTRWDGRKVSNAMLTELDSGQCDNFVSPPPSTFIFCSLFFVFCLASFVNESTMVIFTAPSLYLESVATASLLWNLC